MSRSLNVHSFIKLISVAINRVPLIKGGISPKFGTEMSAWRIFDLSAPVSARSEVPPSGNRTVSTCAKASGADDEGVIQIGRFVP